MKAIGRREELARIAETAGAPREGALLVSGEPGAGKTWLLEQAQANARIRSMVVRAMPNERFWPLSGLARVFAFVSDVDVRPLGAPGWHTSSRSSASPVTAAPVSAAPVTASPVAATPITASPVGGSFRGRAFDDDLPEVEGQLVVLPPPRRTAVSDIPPDNDRFSTARRLLSALRAQSPEPLLVLIDDIDQMDDESQLSLGYMAEALSGTGVRMVATATAVTASSPLAAFRGMALGALSASESRALATRALGTDCDPGTADILADASGGNPATIVRGARAMSFAQRQGREPLTLPLRPTEEPDRLAARLLGGVDPTALRLLEFVSLAAWANSAALLSAVANGPGQGADGDEPRNSDDETRTTDADRLEDLEYAGLLIRQGAAVRIGDPRVRSWLYWSMTPGVRRDRHRRMGLAHRGVDELLEHWHNSFTGGTATTVDAVLAAALKCVTLGERGAAVEFAERGLRLAATVTGHQGQIRALATALLVHSDLSLAARYARRAAVEPGSAQAAVDVATLRIAIEYARTHVVPTNEIDAVVGLYSGSGMPGIGRLLSIAGAFHAERLEIDEARRQLAMVDDFPAAAGDGLRHDDLRHDVATLVDALAGVPLDSSAALALTDLPSAQLSEMPVHSLLLLGTTLSYREQYARARHVFALVITQPRMSTPLWLELARYHLALNELRSGRFNSARLAIEEWMSCVPTVTADTSSRMFLRAWYLQSSGDLAAADALFGECMDRTLTERTPAVAASILAAQGAAALAVGDYGEAARLLELADVIGSRFTNPALLRSSIDLIEAYVNTNRLREARGVLATLEMSQTASPSRWLTLAIARGRGLTAADDRSLALFQHALELYHPDDSPFERGRTLMNLAAVQARLGFVRESEKSLAAAHNAFGNAGASSWAQRVRQGRIADPDVAATVGILTEEEQLIVEKVREGYRNKEIAAELYISLRTVELRLTHIYRKVGARSRSHLAALLN